MARLPRMEARVATLRGRVASFRVDGERTAARGAAWRGWYGLKRWRKLRWQVLTDAMFVCARCGAVNGDTSKLVADHVRPHRGDPGLFWDRGNLQCLCKPCHDGAKQREEAAAGRAGWR